MEQILILEKEIDRVLDTEERSKMHNNAGILYSKLHMYDKALEHHRAELKLCKANSEQKMIAYRFLGEVHRQLKNYDACFRMNENHLDLALKLSKPVEIQRGYCNLGNAYLDKSEQLIEGDNEEEFDRAINMSIHYFHKSFLKASEMLREHNNLKKRDPSATEDWDIVKENLMKLELEAEYNVANARFVRAKWYIDNKDIVNEAMNGLQECIRRTKQTKFRIIEGKAHCSLGLLYFNLKEWDKALEFLGKDELICQKMNELEGLITTQRNIAKVYQSMCRYDEAKNYYMKAYNLVKKYFADDVSLIKPLRREIRLAEEEKADLEAVLHKLTRFHDEIVLKRRQLSTLEELKELESLLYRLVYDYEFYSKGYEVLNGILQHLGYLNNMKPGMTTSSTGNSPSDYKIALAKLYVMYGLCLKHKKQFENAFEAIERALEILKTVSIYNEEYIVTYIDYINWLDEVKHLDWIQLEKMYNEAANLAKQTNNTRVYKVALDNLEFVYRNSNNDAMRSKVQEQISALGSMDNRSERCEASQSVGGTQMEEESTKRSGSFQFPAPGKHRLVRRRAQLNIAMDIEDEGEIKENSNRSNRSNSRSFSGMKNEDSNKKAFPAPAPVPMLIENRRETPKARMKADFTSMYIEMAKELKTPTISDWTTHGQQPPTSFDISHKSYGDALFKPLLRTYASYTSADTNFSLTSLNFKRNFLSNESLLEINSFLTTISQSFPQGSKVQRTPKLMKLNLEGNMFAEDDLGASLCHTLRNFASSLTILNISGLRLNSQGQTAFFQLLNDLTMNLQVVKARNCSFTSIPKDITNNSIVRLDLSYNFLDVQSIVNFMANRPHFTNLQDLNLSCQDESFQKSSGRNGGLNIPEHLLDGQPNPNTKLKLDLSSNINVLEAFKTVSQDKIGPVFNLLMQWDEIVLMDVASDLGPFFITWAQTITRNKLHNVQTVPRVQRLNLSNSNIRDESTLDSLLFVLAELPNLTALDVTLCELSQPKINKILSTLDDNFASRRTSQNPFILKISQRDANEHNLDDNNNSKGILRTQAITIEVE